MNKYKIAISNDVYADLKDIGDLILSKNTPTAVDSYLKSLYEDIFSLTYLAGALPYSQSETLKKIHPKAKRLLSKNKNWNIVFHISGNYAVVDRIILSSMIKD